MSLYFLIAGTWKGPRRWETAVSSAADLDTFHVIVEEEEVAVVDLEVEADLEWEHSRRLSCRTTGGLAKDWTEPYVSHCNVRHSFPNCQVTSTEWLTRKYRCITLIRQG